MSKTIAPSNRDVTTSDLSDADRTLLDALGNVLGPKGLTTDAAAMAPWLADWRGRVRGNALALLSPASTAEVQAVMRIVAATPDVSVTVQGGNTGQCAGATPGTGGRTLLLSLRRMNHIRSIDAASRLINADAGVILSHAHEAAQAVGLRFPLTLGARGSATLGGLVSTNAGGTQVLRHGTMRALTVGLEVVLPDGTLLDAMAPLAKDNRGPDPKQLFLGGEGLFGIVTGVALRLVPDVAMRAVGWFTIDTPHVALDALSHLDAALGRSLEGFEIVPQRALANVLAHIPALRAPVATAGPWHMLVEAVASAGEADPAPAMEAALAALIEAGIASDAALAQSEAQANDWWRIRDAISEAERAIGPALQHDISVPVARMPDYLVDVPVELEAAFAGCSCLPFGHLGDGNIHFHVRPPADSDTEAWISAHGEAVSEAVYRAAIAMGGSMSAEHGIGRTKRAIFARLDPERHALVSAIKRGVDPRGLLNPLVLAG